MLLSIPNGDAVCGASSASGARLASPQLNRDPCSQTCSVEGIKCTLNCIRTCGLRQLSSSKRPSLTWCMPRVVPKHAELQPHPWCSTMESKNGFGIFNSMSEMSETKHCSLAILPLPPSLPSPPYPSRCSVLLEAKIPLPSLQKP